MRLAAQVGPKSFELDVGDTRLVELRGGHRAAAIADVADSVARAIETPIEFPPLRQAIVPGDHVVIVLDDAMPNPGAVLSPLIECVADAGVEPRDMVIVQETRREDGRHRLTPDSLPLGLQLTPHDPADRNNLSYLASTKAGTRVYLNRQVVDADLVVIVGRVDYHPIFGYRGTSSSIFPGLADAAAQQKFRESITSANEPKTRSAIRRESNEVAWLLGAQFAVQVVVGTNDEIVAVFAGRIAEVQSKAQHALDRYWKRTVANQAELVVAIIGCDSDQGFEELGAALSNACTVVRPGGRIAVLSAVRGNPGPMLQAALTQDSTKSLEQLKRFNTDAISTWQILQARRHASLYLLSKLEDDLVTSLSFTPLKSVAEVESLIRQANSCIVMEDAALVHTSLEHDDA
jgi:nickel-dependent lactate racemase